MLVSLTTVKLCQNGKLTIVDSADGRPKLLLLEPWKWVCRSLARVAPFPLAVSISLDEVMHRVGRILQYVSSSRYLALFDFTNLATDTDEGINESIKFFFALTLSWLDHQCIGDRPAHSGRVEPVILETLSDINSLHTS